MKKISILLLAVLLQCTFAQAQYAGGNGRGDVQLRVAGINFSIVGYAGGQGRGDATFRRTGTNLEGVSVPNISSFTPATGCAGSGTVTITGTSFTGATAVSIGGTAVNSFTVNSATQITATIGSGTTGTIQVTNPVGTANSSGSFTVNAAPNWYLDADNDSYYGGSGVMQCNSPGAGWKTTGLLGGNDCNDNSNTIYPGAPETCNSLDDDCDGVADDGLAFVTYYTDVDGDGFGTSLASGISSCSPIPGSVTNNIDCNDSDPAINPAAQETCDGGFDNDCDGLADNADPSVTGQGTYYADNDGDSYGAGPATLSCTATSGFSTNNTDCNDNKNTIYPGAAETCNSLDDDCNGVVDNGLTFLLYYADTDGDGFGSSSASGVSSCSPIPGSVTNNTDCNDNNQNIPAGITIVTYLFTNANLLNPGWNIGCPSTTKVYAQIPSGPDYGFTWADNLPPSAVITNVDLDVSFFLNCNGFNPRSVSLNNNLAGAIVPNGTSCSGCSSPLAVNSANLNSGISNYVKGGVNTIRILLNNGGVEGLTRNIAWSASSNVYGRIRLTVQTPGEPELCNGLDDDCDGLTDEGLVFTNYYTDADGDGYGAGTAINACTQPAGTSGNNTDCDNNNAAINPNASELCNGLDDNCNGTIDEGLLPPIGQVLVNDTVFCVGDTSRPYFTLVNQTTSNFTWQIRKLPDTVWNSIPDTSYTINTGTPPNVADTGSYQIRVVSFGNGNCIAVSNTVSIQALICGSGPQLLVRAFFEGYYTGNSMVTPVLFNAGMNAHPNACDSVTIQLRDPLSPATIVHSFNTIIYGDGWAIRNLPSALANQSYYVVIRHRNSIETWSKLPVSIGAGRVFYDFTTP